jgi:hypothetical protein
MTLLFEIRFCRQAPGKIFLLQKGPYFAQTTLERKGFHNVAHGKLAGAADAIPASPDGGVGRKRSEDGLRAS